MPERFADVAAFLRWLQSDAAHRQIHGGAALALEKMTKLGFRNEVDPYGTPWIPSRRALNEGGQTLTDQGFLRASMRTKFGTDQAEVLLTRNYGIFHQEGLGNNPQRRMVPDEGDLPPSWEDEITRNVDRIIDRRAP